MTKALKTGFDSKSYVWMHASIPIKHYRKKCFILSLSLSQSRAILKLNRSCRTAYTTTDSFIYTSTIVHITQVKVWRPEKWNVWQRMMKKQQKKRLQKNPKNIVLLCKIYFRQLFFALRLNTFYSFFDCLSPFLLCAVCRIHFTWFLFHSYFLVYLVLRKRSITNWR